MVYVWCQHRQECLSYVMLNTISHVSAELKLKLSSTNRTVGFDIGLYGYATRTLRQWTVCLKP